MIFTGIMYKDIVYFCKNHTALQTIRLRVSDTNYKSLMLLLKQFDREDIQVINEDKEFLSVQKYLEKELLNLEKGNQYFVSVEDLDDQLEETIKKYES